MWSVTFKDEVFPVLHSRTVWSRRGKDESLKWRECCFRWEQTNPPSPPTPFPPPQWYLGSDGCSSDVGGGAVLGGRHAAVLLLFVFLLTLYALVLRLAAWRAVRWRREGRRWWRKVLQLVYHLLYLHHRIPQEVNGVWQRREDELEALLRGREGGGGGVFKSINKIHFMTPVVPRWTPMGCSPHVENLTTVYLSYLGAFLASW